MTQEMPAGGAPRTLVNTVEHRNYEDERRKIGVHVFSDRIVVASPGYPPSPLTLAKLRRGNYRPCSRNSVIAQALATMNLMEQRGSGFARMRDTMLNHGLDAPLYGQQDGFFVVTFRGPNGNYERLKLPDGATGLITTAVEAQLNDRQKKIMIQAQKEGFVTSGWCGKTFDVAYQTVYRDLNGLLKLELVEAIGRGRSTRYIPKIRQG